LRFDPRFARPRAISLSIALLIFFSFAVAGCLNKDRGGDAVAKVNGEKILRAELEKDYKTQTAGAPPQQLAGEQSDSLRLSILKQLVDDELMMQRARKLGLLATDEEVETKFNEFKAPYSPEDFDKRLKERNITVDDFKRDLRRSLTVDKVVNKEITSKITVTDAEIAQYFNDHKAEFNFIVPQYHLAQIVIGAAPQQAAPGTKAEQPDTDPRKKIQMVLNRLDTGDDFASVAANYSEHQQSAANGGDIGFIPENSLKTDPAAFEAVSKLKPGQYTNPLPVMDAPRHVIAYRVLKLIAREPAGQRELSDPRVQTAIRQQLRERREQLLRAAYYEVVRNEAKIDNYLAEDLLKNAGNPKK
jgi:peptidyl-prolyl cis-trans isomerase SurA